ncbi:MAG TPA: hypothetical protein VLH56_19275 [Dissulfurispiraceae bacterium]|nr:hypothetical protein [Dissulfurispiraceae bacterium]
MSENPNEVTQHDINRYIYTLTNTASKAIAAIDERLVECERMLNSLLSLHLPGTSHMMNAGQEESNELQSD